MFVSQKQAEARLKEERNIFRDSASEGGTNESSQSNSLIIESPDAGSEVSEMGEEAEVEDDSPTISLSHLDDLLFPKLRGRANYRGKLESQVAIAETELIAGPSMTARTFGLSVPQTQAYSEGLRSTNNITGNIPPKQELLQRINKTKELLAVKAAGRLDMTLNALTPQKISQIKRATNLSKVAKDMSVIMDKCTPKEESDKGAVHFHVWRPEIKNESNYVTVNVGPSLPVSQDPPK